MAEVKIVGNILDSKGLQRYSQEDTNLISSQRIQKEFDPNNDYIESYLYDVGGNLLNSNYNYQNYTVPSNKTTLDGLITTIEIDPVKDIKDQGFNSGEFKSQYNFFKNRISDLTADLFITEISSDRTEIRATSVNISKIQLAKLGNDLINEINTSPYYIDFLLNFGNNQQFIAVNIAVEQLVDKTNLLFKLYQPLPQTINVKNSFWVVEEIFEPYIFEVDLSTVITLDPLPNLKGPNFDIQIEEHNNVPTKYQNYNTLVTNISSSNLTSYQQYLNLANEKGLSINVDYTDFEAFSNFGSAQKRIEIFYNKVKSIEDYNNYINNLTSSVLTNPSLTIDLDKSKQERDTIITNLDGFERYMYFESGSSSWPKTSSNRPYILQSTGSSESISWYTDKSAEAVDYDSENLNRLYYTIPNYIIENDDNEPYLDFVDMVGHYFDNIYIYIKSITNLYQNKNNLYDGISKDLVYQMLKSLGTKLYNSDSDENNQGYLTGNYLGSPTEYANLTGSYINNIPKSDLVAELYKRIYHNLPTLLKSKGTTKGLKQLITTFGITGSILDVREYGGNISSSTILDYSTEKVRVIDNTLEGYVLSPQISLEIEQEDRILDNHIVDVSFSPQNQIDLSISSSIPGPFRIDDYIGDPREEYSGSYESLDYVRRQAISSSFSGSYDYAGFIRLVQFFDNSLFKMLKDSNPARSQISTGITIRPQNLERTKIKKQPPEFDYLELREGIIPAPLIIHDTNYNIYELTPGNKSQFMTGEYSGSNFNTNEYFSTSSQNPYLLSNNNWKINDFENSTLNILYGNITGSRLSTDKLLLDNNISSSLAEYQDYYDIAYAHMTSRYNGSKVISATYNTYTNGDQSYGKTAAIDKYTRKIGLFSEITRSVTLPRRCDVHLKYLVDEFGNLTELNQQNDHWFDVQNLFLAGDSANVSLFNNQKYTNQKNLDGPKPIYSSGYFYSPILYGRATSFGDNHCWQINGNTLNHRAFITVVSSSTTYGTQYRITGSALTPTYPTQNANGTGFVWNYLTLESDDPGNNFTPATTTNSASYLVPESNYYNFQCMATLGISGSSTDNIVANLSIWDITNGIKLAENYNQPTGSINGPAKIYMSNWFGGGAPPGFFNGVGQLVAYSINTFVSASTKIAFKLEIQSKTSGSVNVWMYGTNDNSNIRITPLVGGEHCSVMGNIFTSGSGTVTTSSYVELTTTFSNKLGYYFLPQSTGSGTVHPLYTTYGDVDYPFEPTTGDMILFQGNGVNMYEHTITNISVVNSKVRYTLSPELQIDFRLLPPNNVNYLFLKKVNDETNMVLEIPTKRDGQTSLGLIIPSNIHPDILDSINDITKEVKQKLIDLGEIT
jgi:hypothetical protein